MSRPVKILIVDDHPEIRELIRITFARDNYQIYSAANGQQALDIAQAEHPHVILLDIMMPGMDGYELTRRIRAQRKFKTLPILALTAKAMKGDRERCIEAGMDDYIAKPIQPKSFFEVMKAFLPESSSDPNME